MLYLIFFFLHWKYSIVSCNSKTATDAANLYQKGHKTICTHLQMGAFPNGGNNLAATGVTAHKLVSSKFPSSLEKVKDFFPSDR